MGWPEHFVLDHDELDPEKEMDALRVVPGFGPEPSWNLKRSEAYLTISRHAYEAWVAMNQSGIDLIVDLCLSDPGLREQALDLLAGGFWVGVMCDVDELVRREAVRGDRYVGFASGTSATVHRDMNYDLVIDTTSTPTQELARQVFDAIKQR